MKKNFKVKGKKKVLSPSEHFNTILIIDEIEQQSKGFYSNHTVIEVHNEHTEHL